MKRILISLAALGLTLGAHAQDSATLLKKVETAPVRSETVISRFTEERTPAPTNTAAKPVTLKGDLTFKTTTFLSMIYDNGELFAINGDEMVINRDGRNQVFDTSKNLMMQGLSHTLIYAFEGKLAQLANEQNADISAEKKGSEIIVSVTAKVKGVRGYCKVTAVYDATSCAIKAMQLDEFTGASTYYSMGELPKS